jgi:hypothetical protein
LVGEQFDESLNDDLSKLFRQEIERRSALKAAEDASRTSGNRTTLGQLGNAQYSEKFALLGKRVVGSVIKGSETFASGTYSLGNEKFTVAAQASYRLSDPVLFGLKTGDKVRVEGTVTVAFGLPRNRNAGNSNVGNSIELAGCLFGTDAQQKAAGLGAIKDPTRARTLARSMWGQIVLAPNQARIDQGEYGINNRIILEDLVRNCPATPEGAEAKPLLKQLKPAGDRKPAKDDKPKRKE